jgi:putative transposase
MASKGTGYKEEQIIRIVKEVESGTRVTEVCRKYGVSEQTVYRWWNKYGGLETSALQRLRELEAENNRLKRIVAQQVLDFARALPGSSRPKGISSLKLLKLAEGLFEREDVEEMMKAIEEDCEKIDYDEW